MLPSIAILHSKLTGVQLTRCSTADALLVSRLQNLGTTATCSIAHQQSTHRVAKQRDVLQGRVLLNLVRDLQGQSITTGINAIVSLK